MKLAALFDALAGMNLMGLRLALRDSELARTYLSNCIKNYDELMGRGLPGKDPVSFIQEKHWGAFSPHERVELPTRLLTAGGTRHDELLHLATVTRVLRPRKVFEIGTFMGQTTSIFLMNAPPDARVLTMDLPPEGSLDSAQQRAYLDTDLDLVRERKLAACVYEMGLESRFEQVLCDSLAFDPTPHRGTVELGFIDGAHALSYVQNDTMKMAVMMAERGLVFWHDYGGKGSFRPLTNYLEELARKIPLYRVPGTSLAWAAASDLQRLAATEPGRELTGMDRIDRIEKQEA
jgi:Methyltransferase domain